MKRMPIALTTAVVMTAIAAATVPASAAGDGLPVPGGVDTTHQGVVSPDGSQRYVAVVRDDATFVARINTATGALQMVNWLEGEYTVPGVTIGGDTAGLSHDESSLVLIKPRVSFPQDRTSLVVLDPESLRVGRRMTLEGDFSFDALSPDGETAYLIEYPDPRDPTAYQLRMLDLGSGELVPGSLLPENDPDEQMRGFPLSRATGSEGRWEYTLYDGGLVYGYGPGKPGVPFVHAIDTVGQRTLCIDLDWIPRKQVTRIGLRMSADGSEVEVFDPLHGVIGLIDTTSGEAREVSAPAAAETASDTSAASGGGSGSGDGGRLLGAGLLTATTVGVAAGLIRRRRRHSGEQLSPARPSDA